MLGRSERHHDRARTDGARSREEEGHVAARVGEHLSCCALERLAARLEQQQVCVVLRGESSQVLAGSWRRERRRPRDDPTVGQLGSSLPEGCGDRAELGRLRDLGQHELAWRVGAGQRLGQRQQLFESVRCAGHDEDRALDGDRGLGGGRALEGRIVRQDRLLERLQALARLEPELLVEQAARLLVRVERLGLATRPVEREHELAADALAKRVPGDETFQLGRDRGVTAECELGLDPLLDRRQPQLLEARDLGLREGFVGEVGQRGSPPQSERLFEQLRRPRRLRASSARDELLEDVQVELTSLNLEHVARRAGDQLVGLELLAQPGDVDLERLAGGRGCTIPPESIDEGLARDDLVRVQEENGHERALSRPPELEGSAVARDLQRSEDAELHGPPRATLHRAKRLEKSAGAAFTRL